MTFDVVSSVAASLTAAMATSSMVIELVRRLAPGGRSEAVRRDQLALEMSNDSVQRITHLAEELRAEADRVTVEATDEALRRDQLTLQNEQLARRLADVEALLATAENQRDELVRVLRDATAESTSSKVRWLAASVVLSGVVGALLGVFFSWLFFGK